MTQMAAKAFLICTSLVVICTFVSDEYIECSTSTENYGSVSAPDSGDLNLAHLVQSLSVVIVDSANR
jgi:hypothetical protein